MTNILEILTSQAHAEGGWGYVAGQSAQLEPTCLAILALSLEPERFANEIQTGVKTLHRFRQADGSYRPSTGRQEVVWPTAQVLFVLATLGQDQEVARASAARLLEVRGEALKDEKEAAKTLDIDCRLQGWPWSRGNFSWVEPTAWACLALQRLGCQRQPRVEEGMRLLLDRALDQGGVNYGSKHVFGRPTEPIPTLTALMMLALQRQPQSPQRARALEYLLHQAETAENLDHLGWIKLALDAYRHQPNVDGILPKLDERIAATHDRRQSLNWVQPSPMREALTALALGTARGNPFRLPEHIPEIEVTEAVPPTTRRSFSEKVNRFLRGVAAKALGQLRVLPPQTTVHIAQAPSYEANLADILQQQYESFREQVPLKDKRVVLKPNLVEYHRDRVINTNPQVVGAAIELCRREGAADVVVAEGPGHWRNTEYLVEASGLGDVLRQHGVVFVDLNEDEPVKLPNLGQLTGLDWLYVARTAAEADVLISMPKLKTHHWVGVTLSLKNLFGILPGTCYGWPKNELHWRGIEYSIIDIALSRTPELVIVDGIVGMEGDGPLNGTAKPMGVLVMGNDPLAVDATCCRLMRLDPEKIDYLRLGQFKKLGHIQETPIHQAGTPIADLAQPFETLPHFHKLYVGRSA
ncbi:MAG: DUF362 domain-containing protein [Gemmataceae bacterium]